ncbi:metal-binding protein [Ectobacillus ponti]|uniref:Metal-binding protein n=1 Tax=Ectobacillus ponti TaxID=2961894 RepID=A0AA41X5T1_9BACI|nr:metal-binding protein [Ectobacillus ponti]MCP8967698.1 metal-binding protein [Ectobacillus ponti]
MPSGKTHTRLNLAALPVLGFVLITYKVTDWSLLLPSAAGFLLGTYLLNPDLDTVSAAYRNWGPLRFIWYPYRSMLPHRSFLTHTILLGDMIRVVYAAIALSPLLYLLNCTVLGGQLPVWVQTHRPFLAAGFAGIVAASALHIWADRLNTKRKRVFRRKRR